MKKQIQSAHDILQMDELKCRKRVLRRLQFTTSDDVVEMKGRVACEISSGDELLLTEMIFNGVFNTLLPEYCAALLSCFVFTEKVRCLPFRNPFLLIPLLIRNQPFCSPNKSPNYGKSSRLHCGKCRKWRAESQKYPRNINSPL